MRFVYVLCDKVFLELKSSLIDLSVGHSENDVLRLHSLHKPLKLSVIRMA